VELVFVIDEQDTIIYSANDWGKYVNFVANTITSFVPQGATRFGTWWSNENFAGPGSFQTQLQNNQASVLTYVNSRLVRKYGGSCLLFVVSFLFTKRKTIQKKGRRILLPLRAALWPTSGAVFLLLCRARWLYFAEARHPTPTRTGPHFSLFAIRWALKCLPTASGKVVHKQPYWLGWHLVLIMLCSFPFHCCSSIRRLSLPLPCVRATKLSVLRATVGAVAQTLVVVLPALALILASPRFATQASLLLVVSVHRLFATTRMFAQQILVQVRLDRLCVLILLPMHATISTTVLRTSARQPADAITPLFHAMMVTKKSKISHSLNFFGFFFFQEIFVLRILV
jgi:hypothetical protein